MSDHFPIVLVGNALSLMVAATRLARNGADVAIVNSGKNWGGHFTTITCKGIAFDAGMVLHEFTSYNAQGGGLLGALGSHYIDGLRYWFGEIASVYGQLEALRPDVLDPATNRIVKAETDDTFLFTVQFANGGLATMTSSFAATPTRGARIVVMGDRGTLIAEQPGPNPMEDGIVIGSRDGSPLQPLETPKQYVPFKDARDHRLMAFRLLVRDFTAGIDRGMSPAPNFTDGLRCQEVLDAVRESSRSGRKVEIRGS